MVYCTLSPAGAAFIVLKTRAAHPTTVKPDRGRATIDLGQERARCLHGSILPLVSWVYGHALGQACTMIPYALHARALHALYRNFLSGLVWAGEGVMNPSLPASTLKNIKERYCLHITMFPIRVRDSLTFSRSRLDLVTNSPRPMV